MPQSVGDRIKAARVRKKLSQADLAEKLGVAQSAVSLWETGEALPRSSRIRDLADVLGLKPSDLLPGEAA